MEMMGDAASFLTICTCEKAMQFDAEAIGRSCSWSIAYAHQLGGFESTVSTLHSQDGLLLSSPASRKQL